MNYAFSITGMDQISQSDRNAMIMIIMSTVTVAAARSAVDLCLSRLHGDVQVICCIHISKRKHNPLAIFTMNATGPVCPE
jgi:hypothetical protein